MDKNSIITCVETEFPDHLKDKYLGLTTSKKKTPLFLYGTRNHGERKKRIREMGFHPHIYVVLDKQTTVDQSIIVHAFNKANVVPGKTKAQYARFGMTYGVTYMNWILEEIRSLPGDDSHDGRIDYSIIYEPEEVDET